MGREAAVQVDNRHGHRDDAAEQQDDAPDEPLAEQEQPAGPYDEDKDRVRVVDERRTCLLSSRAA